MNEKKFNKLLSEFHQNLKYLRNLTDITIKTYISCIIKYEKFADNNLNIDLLQSNDEHLFEFLLDLKKTGSPGRVTQYRTALKRFFEMLLYYGEIDKNPALNLLPVKRKRSTRYNYIPQDILIAVIDAIDKVPEKETKLRNAKKSRDKMMILFLWCLGLRSGEMRSVKKEDINIIDSDKKIALLTVHGKGAKERALLIMDKLFEETVKYILPFNNCDFIFPGKTKSKIDDTTVNKRIKKYVTFLGCNIHITAHCLRHSFATEMYYANVPLEAIRVMMGHDQLRETSIYIHVSRKDIINSLNLLNIGV
jgi:integrase/recombinase XerD